MTTNTDKLRDPKILRKIGKLVSAGVTYIGVSQRLKADDNINAIPATVKRIYDEFSIKTTDIIAGDKELKSLIKADILGIVDQMKAINSEAWDILRELQQSEHKQPGTQLKALKEIRGQLELNLKLSEQLTSSMDMAKVNKVELTQNIINIFEKLKTDGYGEIEKCPNCGWSKNPDPANFVKSFLRKEKELAEKVTPRIVAKCEDETNGIE